MPMVRVSNGGTNLPIPNASYDCNDAYGGGTYPRQTGTITKGTAFTVRGTTGSIMLVNLAGLDTTTMSIVPNAVYLIYGVNSSGVTIVDSARHDGQTMTYGVSNYDYLIYGLNGQHTITFT